MSLFIHQVAYSVKSKPFQNLHLAIHERIWFYGPLFLPRAAQRADPAEPISILTFNLRDTNTDTDVLLATLTASQADVLALQEVSNLHEEHLGQALAGRYPYRFYYESAGLAIYSLYPILAQEILPMQLWPAQSIVIKVRETPLHLINAHLAQASVLLYFETLDASLVWDLANAGETQIAQIQGAIRETSLPAIVACDCNMTDLMSAYAQITATLRDAHRERGWGLGHTFLVPRGFEIPSNYAVCRDADVILIDVQTPMLAEIPTHTAVVV